VVERSALSQFGLRNRCERQSRRKHHQSEEAKTATSPLRASTTPLIFLTAPTIRSNKDSVQTYVDYNKPTSEDLTTRSGNITTAIKGYNSALSTYQFQKLVEEGSRSPSTTDFRSDKMKSYSKIKRQSAIDSAFTTWSDNWKSYAEVLAAPKKRPAPLEPTRA
jgi:Flp pilus assembly protein TadG